MQFNYSIRSKTPPLAPPRIRGGEVKASPEFGGGVAPATEGVGTPFYFVKEHHRVPTAQIGSFVGAA